MRTTAASLPALALAIAVGASAAAQDGSGIGGPDGVNLLSSIESRRISAVEVVAEGSTGDLARDREALEAARAALGLDP